MNIEWRDVKGFEGLYKISSHGQVYSIRGDLNLKQRTTHDGYLAVTLSNKEKSKYFTLHRLVALNFIENTHNKKTVNHINGIKKDNSVGNLEWCTQKENIRHSCRIGLRGGQRGVNGSKAKLDCMKVLTVRSMVNHRKQNYLGKHYGVCQTSIWDIKHQKTWAWHGISNTEILQDVNRLKANRSESTETSNEN